MVIARAEDFGLSGYESSAELDENRALYDRMEPIRIAAGRLMGMGEVHDSGDDRLLGAAGTDVAYQRHVELDDVRLKLRE